MLRKLALIATAMAVLVPAQAHATPAVARADGYEIRATADVPLGVGRAHLNFRATASNHGLVYALAGRRLVAHDRAGARRRVVSLRSVSLRKPRGLAFAPTSDLTDAPSARHLYIADHGEILEVGFDTHRLVASAAAVTTERPPLLKTIATSAWSPPSPDPSGIAYDAAADGFIVADSEVEEMTLYSGTNLWTTPRGALTATGGVNTRRFSSEPTGLALNPADRTLFVSDDDAARVNVVKAGPDTRFGTADDTFTRISTSALGITDAEDVAYDTVTGHLFVCDGSGREIWNIDPVNGIFGDAGDRVASHFDLAVHGEKDCEGVALDYGRDTLLTVDPYARKVYEFTRSGSLVRILDMSATPTDAALASIVEAPTSSTGDNPGALSYWLTDRHIDNGENPKENDGRIFEMGIPGGSGPTDAPPSVSVTQPAAGSTVSGTVKVAATASDDIGVSSVRFRVDGTDIGTDTNGADGWSASWDTGSAANGAHSLTAVATDSSGNTSAAAPVAVTVANAVQSTFAVPVRAGSDDADELQGGTVQLDHGDLELGHDHDIATTAGVRFTGLAIPRGARIVRASVQFTADELDRALASDVISAQAADNAPAFTSAASNVSSRPRTVASAAWIVPTWTVFDEAGAPQQTTDLSAVVQEVVNRPGWAPGNALVLLITGSGRRTAESYEGGYPPVLTVEFATS